jgi:hypothetical protein
MLGVVRRVRDWVAVLVCVRLRPRAVARADRADLERRVLRTRAENRAVDPGGAEEAQADARHPA